MGRMRASEPVPGLNWASRTQASRKRTYREPSGANVGSTGRERPVAKTSDGLGRSVERGSRERIQPCTKSIKKYRPRNRDGKPNGRAALGQNVPPPIDD